MNANKEEARETFEDWEFVMDDALRDFYKKLPEELSDSLDYSSESLELLENYIIQHFTAESIEDPQNMYWLDGFARYVGEAFKENLKGARWDINLEHEDEIFFSLPLIIGARNQVSAYCPHMEVVTALHRKKGNFIRTLLEKAILRQQ
jgi:hypothetical protein